MERRIEQMGVGLVVALAAVFIVAYSLWGATVLKHERQANRGEASGISLLR